MSTKKIKPLLPSLKEKKRYLLFKVHSKGLLGDFKSINNEIHHSCLSFMGQKGTAQAGLWVLPDKYDQDTQTGILRTGNKFVHDVKTSLSLIKKINSEDVVFQTLLVSGTLKKLSFR